jgi:hypothetical protein
MRTARVEQTCSLCGGSVHPGESIRGVDLGDMTRWVHASCAPTPAERAGAAETARPARAPTTPEAQRGALTWARAQLDAKRRAGWAGDDAGELARLRREALLR